MVKFRDILNLKTANDLLFYCAKLLHLNNAISLEDYRFGSKSLTRPAGLS